MNQANLLGSTVLYVLTDEDALQINRSSNALGHLVCGGRKLPGIVVDVILNASSPARVNIQLFRNGPGELVWIEAALQGDGPGCWQPAASAHATPTVMIPLYGPHAEQGVRAYVSYLQATGNMDEAREVCKQFGVSMLG